MANPPSPHRIWLGRSREMRELEQGVAELVGGRGGLYLLTGEPGIGKTRLADEVGLIAEARGALVHWGRAWEAGGAPSYWPFIQALRSMAREGRALDALTTPTDTAIGRFELFEIVGDFLRRVTTRPRLLVLDDLHAADPPSLELLHFLARDLRSQPLMVIGTYREAEARLSLEIRPLLARIAREASVLPLRRLDREDVAAYLAQSTGIAPTNDRVEELYLRTEGNPLFLRELLRLGGTQAHGVEGIREVVRTRLALLGRASRAALEAAAVLGREFAAPQLAAVAGLSETDVRALMEPAANAAIIEPLDDPPRWRFTHVLLRQGVYDDLPSERRSGLHRAAAAELSRRPGGPPLAELAHHLLHAMPAVSAVEAARGALRAADHAMGLLAFEDARTLYGSAEELLAGLATEERTLCEAILGGGLACMRMAEVDRGKAACARAAELARRLTEGDLFARAVLTAGYEHTLWARDITAIAQLEEALAILPPGDGALRARCMAQLAAEQDPAPDPQPLVQMAREAVAMARRVGDPHALRFTLTMASLAMFYGEPTERIALNRETLRLALAAADQRVALRAHGFLAGDHWELGDPLGAEPHVRAVESLVREFSHGRFRWFAALPRAIEALARGRFDEAARLQAEARASLESDEARGALMAAAPIGFACAVERYDDVAGVEANVRAAFGSIPDELAGLLGEMLIAQLWGRMGDRGRARAQLDTVAAHPLFRAIVEPSWLAMLTDACHLVGDLELADRLYRAMRSRADRFVWLGPLTVCVDLPYARHLGLVAETMGRLDDAVAHLEDAEVRARRADMRAHLARLWYEISRVLVRRGRAGDHARAVAFVAQARGLANELGQKGLLAQLAALGFEGDTDVLRGPPAADPRLALRREGEFWSIRWADRVVRLRDSRGLAFLARLVESPGEELHVLQLMSPAHEPRDGGDAGPTLDAEAVRNYRRRLLELREELEEAERFNDTSRAERHREEMDLLTRELARAVGFGGRPRRSGQAAERARTAVQKRLREAIRRIEAELPELGRHLDQAIRTGLFCGYFPDRRRS